MLLAIAVNFEPTRIGLLPLLLARERPLMQLAAYLVGSLTISLSFGLLVLFVFHRNPFGNSPADGGRAQIIVGALAIAVAAAMAVRAVKARRKAELVRAQLASAHADSDGLGSDGLGSDGLGSDGLGSDGDPAEAQPGRVDRFSQSVRNVLGKGRSPWLAGLIGVGVGLPSVDYLAVLMIIATSGASQTQQATVLVTSVFVGSLVVIAPFIGYLINPEKTLDTIARFGAWTRSRSQIEYAALLAFAGAMLIGIGWSHL